MLGETSQLISPRQANGFAHDIGVPGAQVSKNSTTNILEMPNEIIGEIQSCLPLASQLALGYTCRTLRRLFDQPAIVVLGRPPPLPKPGSQYRWNGTHLSKWDSERSALRLDCFQEGTRGLRDRELCTHLELMTLLERDGFWTSHAVCSYCVTTHDKKLFPEDSLWKGNKSRRCLGSTGKIWTCPHTQITYNSLVNCCNSPFAIGETQAQTERELEKLTKEQLVSLKKDVMHESPALQRETLPALVGRMRELDRQMEELAMKENTKACSGCRKKAKETIETCYECRNMVKISSWGLSCLSFPLMRVEPTYACIGMFQLRDEVEAILHKLEMPICPHLRLNSPEIMEVYSCHRREPSSDCGCQSCKDKPAECKMCQANYKFELDEPPTDATDNRLLRLVVKRDFGSVKGITDINWIRHLTQPVDLEAADRAWERTMDNCSHLVRLRSSLCHSSRCKRHNHRS